MAYPLNTASILVFMYPQLAPSVDYSVSYANGVISLNWYTQAKPKPTDEQVAQQELLWRNVTTWAAQAAARKDREAKAALVLPDSENPEILRRKLNAALYLLGR